MTHTAKHTPGPWVVDEVSEDNAGQTTLGVYADPEAGNAMGYICGIHCAEGVDITDTDQANATLVATSPVMYAELRKNMEVLIGIRDFDDTRPTVRKLLQERINATLAALSQAEGRDK